MNQEGQQGAALIQLILSLPFPELTFTILHVQFYSLPFNPLYIFLTFKTGLAIAQDRNSSVLLQPNYIFGRLSQHSVQLLHPARPILIHLLALDRMTSSFLADTSFKESAEQITRKLSRNWLPLDSAISLTIDVALTCQTCVPRVTSEVKKASLLRSEAYR